MKWIDKLFRYMLAGEVLPRDPALATKIKLRQMQHLQHYDAVKAAYEPAAAWARSYDNFFWVELAPLNSWLKGDTRAITEALLHELGHVLGGHIRLNAASLSETLMRNSRIDRQAQENAKARGVAFVGFDVSAQERREETEAARFAAERINEWLPIAEKLRKQEI